MAKKPPQDLLLPQGFTADVKITAFRPTKEQRADLEREAKRRGSSIGEEVRRRCFPAGK